MPLVLRLPISIHRQATICAEADAISLNQWLASVVSMAVARAECGQELVPQDRLEAIATDGFCDADSEDCKTDAPKVGVCVACDAIYAARECLSLRRERAASIAATEATDAALADTSKRNLELQKERDGAREKALREALNQIQELRPIQYEEWLRKRTRGEFGGFSRAIELSESAILSLIPGKGEGGL